MEAVDFGSYKNTIEFRQFFETPEGARIIGELLEAVMYLVVPDKVIDFYFNAPEVYQELWKTNGSANREVSFRQVQLKFKLSREWPTTLMPRTIDISELAGWIKRHPSVAPLYQWVEQWYSLLQELNAITSSNTAANERARRAWFSTPGLTPDTSPKTDEQTAALAEHTGFYWQVRMVGSAGK